MARLFSKRTGKAGRAGAGRDETRHLVCLLHDHAIDTVFDVGANTGQYGGALRVAGYAGRIVSFEPVASAHASLCAASAGDPRWIAAPRMAHGADQRDVTIHVAHNSDMSSILPIRAATLTALPKSYTVATEAVQQRSLDEVFPEFADDGARVFVKIDTQGYERDVLDGAIGVLARIRGLQLELSLFALYDGETTYLDILSRLSKAGFEPYLFLPGYFSKRLGRQLQFDGVFFRAPAEG